MFARISRVQNYVKDNYTGYEKKIQRKIIYPGNLFLPWSAIDGLRLILIER